MLHITATYTDLYQLTMAQVYFKTGRADEEASFDYFFRKLPFNGGFVVFAGLQDLLHILHELRFDRDDLDYLRSRGFESDFLEYLKSFRFTGSVYAVREGDVIFPTRPVLRVEAGLVDAQIVETLLLNMLNFQSLIATKAARIRLAAGDSVVSEFGLRRAQGLGGYHASRAAVIGGADSTSNVRAAIDFKLESIGTMAHSFVQGHESELSAFRDYASVYPDACVLLVDTYNTLESGIPNAITVAAELSDRGHKLSGVRLDSGDLAYLSKRARHMLDEAGLKQVKIVVSNQLDEYVIRSLKEQQAPIDVFGVGTSLATGAPDAALDGVYKLSFSGGKPRIKLSESIKKLTLPAKKQVYRIMNGNGMFLGADVVSLAGEPAPDRMFDPFEPQKSLDLGEGDPEPQLFPVMEHGEIMDPELSTQIIADYCRRRIAMLPEEYKRFDNPHIYKIGISRELMDLRHQLASEYRET